jgi:phospholipase D1/2
MMRARVAAALRTMRLLGPVGPAMALAAALPIAGVAAPLLRLVPALQESGVAGAALFAFGAGTLAALSLIPMHLLAILAGWTFSVLPGLPVVFAGLLAAAALGYALSTWLAGRRVVDLIGEHPKGRAVHEALVAAGPSRAVFVVALLRLSPVMPFAATNLAMAALHVPFAAFMIGTLAGMLPRIVGGVLVGTSLTQLDLRAPDEAWPAAFGIGATILAVMVIGRIAARALRRLSAHG